jgi:proteasome lid subunit RPN8/RPN11
MEKANRLSFTAELYEQLVWHARSAYPREAVGLLGGSVTGWVSVVLPLANIAAGNRAFIADPFEQFCALHRLQAENLELLGIYHSHPDGGVDPSADDFYYASRWSCPQVIIALRSAESDLRLRAFLYRKRGSIENVRIQIRSAAPTRVAR